MRTTIRCARRPIGALVALCSLALATTAAATPASPAATANCTAANTEVWLGLGLGGGTAGSTYYPLEFSNVGRQACALSGFPGVSAYGKGGGQVGPAASRKPQRHSTVTLAPGATAHAILRVVDWARSAPRRWSLRASRCTRPARLSQNRFRSRSEPARAAAC